MDVIFDVDGTLLNIEHRVPLIRPTDGSKKDWEAFRNKACDDVPHPEIVEIARAMAHAKHRLVICTGRMEKERAVTHASLLAAGMPMYGRPDHVIKLEMLPKIREHGYEPCLVFDDRQQVVDMWRSIGLRVCQVAPGDF